MFSFYSYLKAAVDNSYTFLNVEKLEFLGLLLAYTLCIPSPLIAHGIKLIRKRHLSKNNIA